MTDIRQIYESNFDSNAYVNEYLIRDDYEQRWLVEDFYHRIFSQGNVRGKTLIDVGCGPVMRSALSAVNYVSEIYLAEFLKCNRDVLRKWLHNAPDAVDYSNMFKYVANLEGKDDIKYLEERVRKCVKDVIFCDILADNPLSPLPMQQYDVVTSSYCVDSFSEYEDYKKAWNNIAALTRSGGYVLSIGTSDCSYYKVGDKILPASSIKDSRAKTVISESGLQILEFETTMVKNSGLDSDWTGVYMVVAQKS